MLVSSAERLYYLRYTICQASSVHGDFVVLQCGREAASEADGQRTCQGPLPRGLPLSGGQREPPHPVDGVRDHRAPLFLRRL